ncbi:hypothetical protein J2852_001134 [Azospirillum soli]|nr:hypothetical protein [Azospirillum soli]
MTSTAATHTIMTTTVKMGMTTMPNTATMPR